MVEKEYIKKAKENLNKSKKPIEPGRIVAELSFGFWTSLFDKRYEHQQILWPKLLKPTFFPFLPKSKRTREFLSKELNEVRRLRNRIFHYEPIWYWKDLGLQHERILTLIKAISSEAYEFMTLFDQFKVIYISGKEMIRKKLLNFPNSDAVAKEID